MQNGCTINLDNFKVIGISYEKADVETRGQYAFFPEQVEAFCNHIKASGFEHLFVLSTCNRTEIYFFGDDSLLMKKLYCETVNGDYELFDQVTFVKEKKAAVKHLFRVSAGLESQILGDFEVLSQIKIWFNRFKKFGCTNSCLERFINYSIQISKQIKNETALSDGATSVSYAAVQYILQNVINFQDKNILLFGTGKIGRNTCENLVKHIGHNHITLVNRTPEKAEILSHKLNVTAQPIEKLKSTLQATDIMIVSTGAQQPTVLPEMIPKGKKLLILDLSIPENVSHEVVNLENVTVINVDELSQVINQTMEQRRFDIPKAETIIRLKMWEFEDWLASRQFVPAIEAFEERLDFLKNHEKKQLQKNKIEPNGGEPVSERLIHKLRNQFASFLMEHPENAEETIDLINQMFHLDINEK